MAEPPVIVLVPGSFTVSSQYDSLVKPLREKGYTLHVLEPPCYPAGYKARSDQSPPGLADDAKFVHDFVEKIVEEGKEVVMFAHSYGGVPASECLKGITAKEMAAQSKKGGVLRIAYMTCVVPRVGESLGAVMAANKGGMTPINIDEDGWMSNNDPVASAALVFNSLPPAEGAVEAAKFGKHSSTCFGDNLMHAGYMDLPVSWLFCEDDKCVTPEVQQSGIAAIEESWKGTEREGRSVEVTRLDVDHVPFLTKGDEVRAWVIECVRKGQADRVAS
ncbi:hypothetical protein NX059_011628 [Plenodomus lindquistii]|nr:hypothetical protein NX059_011628 [Plenodomus lindquistii]